MDDFGYGWMMLDSFVGLEGCFSKDSSGLKVLDSTRGLPLVLKPLIGKLGV